MFGLLQYIFCKCVRINKTEFLRGCACCDDMKVNPGCCPRRCMWEQICLYDFTGLLWIKDSNLVLFAKSRICCSTAITWELKNRWALNSDWLRDSFSQRGPNWSVGLTYPCSNAPDSKEFAFETSVAWNGGMLGDEMYSVEMLHYSHDYFP